MPDIHQAFQPEELKVDSMGSTNTLMIRFNLTEKGRKKIERFDSEHIWVNSVMFFLNCTGGSKSDRIAVRGAQYAALTIGHPTEDYGRKAIYDAMKSELDLKPADIKVFSVTTQVIFAAFKSAQSD